MPTRLIFNARKSHVSRMYLQVLNYRKENRTMMNKVLFGFFLIHLENNKNNRNAAGGKHTMIFCVQEVVTHFIQ